MPVIPEAFDPKETDRYCEADQSVDGVGVQRCKDEISLARISQRRYDGDDTKKRKRYAVLFIEIAMTLQVRPKQMLMLSWIRQLFEARACQHEQEGHHDSRSILSGGHIWTVRVRPLPFRMPRHPDYLKLPTWKTDYLLLEFANLEERKLFHEELELRFRVRDAQLSHQNDFGNRIRDMENQRRCQKRHLSVSTAQAHGRSMSDPSSTISLPPKLEILETDTGLDLDFDPRPTIAKETSVDGSQSSPPLNMASRAASAPIAVPGRTLQSVRGQAADRTSIAGCPQSPTLRRSSSTTVQADCSLRRNRQGHAADRYPNHTRREKERFVA
jgi:hypothetical protein